MHDVLREQMTKSVPFVGTVGIEINAVDAGSASARLVQQERVSNHIGSMHAGALFTLGETASGAAMSGAFALRLPGIRPIATGATIAYRKIAKGDIVAHATVLTPAETLLAILDGDGRVAFDVDVVLNDALDATVATMTVGWLITKR